MITLASLLNTHRPKKKVQRVGRGIGSKRGKTCGRGNKGDKARMGYKRRYGHEGGQLPLYRKLPCRGFSNARFANEIIHINLDEINKLFTDGDVVNLESLQKKGYAPRRAPGGFKVLGRGDLSKKVTIEANHFSRAALNKLDEKRITYKTI